MASDSQVAGLTFLESDCATVVHKLEATEMDRSVVSAIIPDTRDEGRQFRSFVVRKVGTELNKIAHELAQLSVSFKAELCEF